MKRNKTKILYLILFCTSTLAGCVTQSSLKSVSGCATQSSLKSVSACQIGCSPVEIEIKDFNQSRSIPPIHSWTAICNHKTYSCSGNLEQSTCALKQRVQNKPVIKGGSDMKNLVMSFQKALNNMGFDAGPVDGIMGKKTRISIELFQHEKNLPVTGRPDIATKKELLGK